MNTLNHISAEHAGLNSDPRGQYSTVGSEFGPLAIRCLRVRDQKAFAASLNVAPRTINKWANGECGMPARRALQIVAQTKEYLRDLAELYVELDRVLDRAYAGRDPGRF